MELNVLLLAKTKLEKTKRDKKLNLINLKKIKRERERAEEEKRRGLIDNLRF